MSLYTGIEDVIKAKDAGLVSHDEAEAFVKQSMKLSLEDAEFSLERSKIYMEKERLGLNGKDEPSPC